MPPCTRNNRRIVAIVPLRSRRLRGAALAAVTAGSALVAAALPGITAVAPAGFRPAPPHPTASAGRMVAAGLGARVTVLARGLGSSRPPSAAQCRSRFGGTCYTPAELASAYGVKPLWDQGITGRGRTVVVVDSWGSPTLRADVRHFDRAFGLPAAHIAIDRPSGHVPAYRPTEDGTGWALETTLDVDYAHAMAPGATIRVLETPVDETEGTHGLPQMMHAEHWAVIHDKGDVISQSFGATEATFSSHHAIEKLRYAFRAALRHHVTVLGASGDNGATDLTRSMNSTYRHRVQSWPSSDPLVTSVGGLSLHLRRSGRRNGPDSVWDNATGAGGGGTSAVFRRPAWQDRVRGQVGSARGVPDISMSADPDHGALVWTSFRGETHGWQLIGGTSLATPLFAGVIALADQSAKHRLGDINPLLYRIAGRGAKARRAAGIVDVTHGSNSHDGVNGWKAHKGFDLASGWGTVDATTFVPALVRASR